MAVRWLRSALRDLSRITAHIGRDNPRAAEALALSVQEKVTQLAKFPYLGRASEQQDIRELVVHESYLVSYRVRREAIEILQVWHTAQERQRRP